MLWKECAARGIRCIHYSTDCVFDGKKGRPYTEQDRPTAPDVYGLTKFLGEIGGPSALTIRTSIIGPELRGKHSLLEWFLAQTGRVRGFTGAVYTGLPASEHARILAEHILPRETLQGLYHISASPITKCDLLRLVAQVYEKRIEIVPDDTVQEDRSLSCEAFRAVTGYVAPPWPEMIGAMREAHTRSAAQWE
jgi:dTDP-4-dehydrorhamnose reductase